MRIITNTGAQAKKVRAATLMATSTQWLPPNTTISYIMKKWRIGKSAARACNAGSMANVGYAVPTMEKLNTPHSEHYS